MGFFRCFFIVQRETNDDPNAATALPTPLFRRRMHRKERGKKDGRLCLTPALSGSEKTRRVSFSLPAPAGSDKMRPRSRASDRK